MLPERRALVAQLVEQRFCKPKVAGSIPAGGTRKPLEDCRNLGFAERCRRREFDGDILLLSTTQGVKLRVRRLVEVRMVRRVLWRDDV